MKTGTRAAMSMKLRCVLAMVIAGLGGCGGCGADFGVEAASDPVPVIAGSGRWVKVDLTREDGFAGDVIVTISDSSSRVTGDTMIFTGESATEPLRIWVDPDTAPGELSVKVVASSGDDSTSTELVLDVLEAQPSSQELIAAALAAGQIDLGTSLLYRSQAQLGDFALPEQYRGSGPEEDLGLAFNIRAATQQLSPAAVAALRPYTVRPADPDSVYALASARKAPSSQLAARSDGWPMIAPEDCAGGNAWRSKRSAQIPVRVWIECDGAEALEQSAMVRVLALFEKLWGPMTTVFSVPLNDAGGPDEGGDDAIDVYLVRGAISRGGEEVDIYTLLNMGVAAVARSAPSSSVGQAKNSFGNDVDSGFILMPWYAARGEDARSTVTHELAHILQFAHNTETSFANSDDGPYWFYEASATWASVHFDRTLTWPARVARATHEGRFARYLKGGVALNAAQPVLNRYAAYIWALFMEQEVDSALVGKIWNSFDGAKSPRQGDDFMNDRFSFADNFQTFALRNLNQAFTPGDPLPIAERYKGLDKEFPDGEPTPFRHEVTIAGDKTYEQDLVMPPLSTNYVQLEIEGGVSKVELFFGMSPAAQLDISALIQPDDTWLAEPLTFTGENKVVFCFDKGLTTPSVRGEFKTMQLVISNHAHAIDARVGGKLRITASNGACGVWRGTTRSVLTHSHVGGNILETTDTNVVLEYDEENSSPGFRAHKLQSGTYVHRHDFTSVNRTPPCRTFTDSAGTMFPAMLLDQSPGATSANLSILSGMPETYVGNGASWVTATTTTSCNNSMGIDETSSMPAYLQWWMVGFGAFEVDLTGTSISGTETVPDQGTGRMVTYTWNFTKVDE